MSKHVFLGDVHLGKGVGIGKPASGPVLNSRIQDQLFLLNWTLERAVEYQADSIIITGDVYEESRPTAVLIKSFMAWLKRCEHKHIAVHVIAGNHDIARSGNYVVSTLDIIPAVELPHATTYKNISLVEYDDVTFTLVPFRDRRMYDVDSTTEALAKLKDELSQVKLPVSKTKVLIGHLSLEGSIAIGDEIDDMMNEIFCPASMFGEYDYVWMGHIHKPQVVSTKPHIAHVGSMDRSDFHESETTGDKIIVLFNSSGPSFETIVIPTRPLQQITINVPPDKDTTDFVKNHLFVRNKSHPLKDAIVKLEIQLTGSEAMSADRDKITKYLYTNLGVHHICGFTEPRTIAVVTQNQLMFDSSISIPSAIKTFSDRLSIEQQSRKDRFVSLAMDCVDDYKAKYEQTGGSVE